MLAQPVVIDKAENCFKLRALEKFKAQRRAGFRILAKALHEVDVPICHTLIKMPSAGVVKLVDQAFILLLNAPGRLDLSVKDSNGVLFKCAQFAPRREM